MKKTVTWTVESDEPQHTGKRCWCKPVVAYRSRITGCKVELHRNATGEEPPADLMAYACWCADSPGQDDEAPDGGLTFYG